MIIRRGLDNDNGRLVYNLGANTNAVIVLCYYLFTIFFPIFDRQKPTPATPKYS